MQELGLYRPSIVSHAAWHSTARNSLKRRGPGWRIHGSVEDTKLSTNNNTLSLPEITPLARNSKKFSLHLCTLILGIPPLGVDFSQGESDNANPSEFFFTLVLRSFILLRKLEYRRWSSLVGSRSKGDQGCARGLPVLQYTRKHGLVRERRVCITSGATPSLLNTP